MDRQVYGRKHHSKEGHTQKKPCKGRSRKHCNAWKAKVCRESDNSIENPTQITKLRQFNKKLQVTINAGIPGFKYIAIYLCNVYKYSIAKLHIGSCLKPDIR
jgi:hypothetical protein